MEVSAGLQTLLVHQSEDSVVAAHLMVVRVEVLPEVPHQEVALQEDLLNLPLSPSPIHSQV